MFTTGTMDLSARCARLPPRDHSLSWAAEIHDENLRRLTMPGVFSANPLLEKDRLQWFLRQEELGDCESMLVVLHERRLARPDTDYGVRESLEPAAPVPDLVEVEQGHYRIGGTGRVWERCRFSGMRLVFPPA